MAFKFGRTSLARLVGVDPLLVACCKRAIARSPFDFIVVEGRRSLERQQYLYSKGRTIAGPIVTWTMNSKHLTGRAVDLAPLNGKGKIPWHDKELFKQLADLMFQSAADLNIKIRWGADWSMNGVPYEKGEYDGPHFELVD